MKSSAGGWYKFERTWLESKRKMTRESNEEIEGEMKKGNQRLGEDMGIRSASIYKNQRGKSKRHPDEKEPRRPKNNQAKQTTRMRIPIKQHNEGREQAENAPITGTEVLTRE
jgi:hypothetical protein